MPWSPPGADPNTPEVLYEGIPAWMDYPFRTWFCAQLVGTVNGRPSWKTGLVQTFDTAMRRREPLTERFRDHGPEWLYKSLTEDELLLFADLIVYQNDRTNATRWNEQLERILVAAGSSRRVGMREGQAGLERRVPLGVQETAEAVMSTTGTAGTLLSEAWHLAFGQDPDPEKAYSKAVLAVEAAVAPTVLPNDKDRRLGKAVQQMRVDGDWRPAFDREHEHAKGSDVLVAMIRTLQAGQQGRHVEDGNQSSPPTQEAAEAAVVLAVPLVQWFASATARRRP